MGRGEGDDVNDINLIIKVILAVCGAIVTIGGATAVISRWLSPYKALKKTIEGKADKSELEAFKGEFERLEKSDKAEIEALKDEFERLKRYQTEDHERLKEVERGNNEICKCLFSLINHEVTGNGIESLKQARDEMQKYLIERK